MRRHGNSNTPWQVLQRTVEKNVCNKLSLVAKNGVKKLLCVSSLGVEQQLLSNSMVVPQISIS